MKLLIITYENVAMNEKIETSYVQLRLKESGEIRK